MDFTKTAHRGYKMEDVEGDLVLRDVEILGELPVGAAGNRKPIDAEWLQGALDSAQKRAAGGYDAPLHVYHHKGEPGTEDGTIPAGTFLPTKVVDGADVDGKKTKILLADLRITNPDIQKQVRAGRLLHRSVEIMTSATKNIDSLALLPAAAPHCKFPGLRPRVGVRLAQNWITCAEDGKPLEHEEEPEKKPFEKGEEKPEEKPEETETDSCCGTCAETNEMVRHLLDVLQELADTETGQQTPYNEARKMAETPVESVKLADAAPEIAELRKQLGELIGSVAGLKAEMAARSKVEGDAQIERDAMLSLAEWPAESVKLAAPGIKAALKAGGKEAVDAMLSTFKATTPKDVKSAAEALTGVAVSSDPPEVLTFAKDGPERLALARKHATNWRIAKSLGVTNTPLAAFLTREMAGAQKSEMNPEQFAAYLEGGK